MVEAITILGHPYVKKSNQKVKYNHRTGRSVKYDTPSYKLWHQEALRQLAALGYDPQFKRKNKILKDQGRSLLKAKIDEPINLQCRFYLATAGRVDLSALYEGIQDVLVEVGLLADDNYKIVCSHDGSGAEKDAADPRIEVTITTKQEQYER